MYIYRYRYRYRYRYVHIYLSIYLSIYIYIYIYIQHLDCEEVVPRIRVIRPGLDSNDIAVCQLDRLSAHQHFRVVALSILWRERGRNGE